MVNKIRPLRVREAYDIVENTRVIRSAIEHELD